MSCNENVIFMYNWSGESVSFSSHCAEKNSGTESYKWLFGNKSCCKCVLYYCARLNVHWHLRTCVGYCIHKSHKKHTPVSDTCCLTAVVRFKGVTWGLGQGSMHATSGLAQQCVPGVQKETVIFMFKQKRGYYCSLAKMLANYCSHMVWMLACRQIQHY